MSERVQDDDLGGVIDIPSFEAFLEDNEQVLNALNRCCVDVAEINSNLEIISQMTVETNDLLRDGQVSDVTITEVNSTILPMLSKELVEDMYNISSKAFQLIENAARYIKYYNEDGIETTIPLISPTGEILTFDQIASAGVSNLMWSLVECGKYHGLGYILGIGCDMYRGATLGDFGPIADSYGNACSYITWAFLKKMAMGQTPTVDILAMSKEASERLQNLCTITVAGTVAAMINMIYTYFTEDWGELTNTEVWSIVAVDGLQTFGSFALGVAVGNLIAGAPGVIVGTLVSIAWDAAANYIKNEYTDDTFIGSFTVDGQVYPVPRAGKENSWETYFNYLIQRYENNYEYSYPYLAGQYDLRDANVNNDYYFQLLYSENWDDATRLANQALDENNSNRGRSMCEINSYGDDMKEFFNSFLRELVQCETEEQARSFISNYPNTLTNLDAIRFRDMKDKLNSYGFNCLEYYRRNHI